MADSYDYALFRAHKIYLRTKLQLVAEFEAVGLTTRPLSGNGFFMDKCLGPFFFTVFGNPVTLPFSILWAKTLTNNPMKNDENQDDWDGRMRFFETRVSEVVDHRSARIERRVGEQIRENSTTTTAQIAETRQQIVELRTETRQQIAELSSGVSQMRRQMDEMTAALRSLAAQRA